MTIPSQPNQHYPELDRQLFEGSFSGKLRELAFGSSRWDTLSAIRRASLDSWTVSASGDTVELLSGGVHIRITPKRENSIWVKADTLHGEFSLSWEHWISQQINRRIERRVEGYRLQLQAEAESAYTQLCERIGNNRPHEWQKETVDGWLTSSCAHISRPYSCALENGFVVEVVRDVFSGNIPMEAAVSDAIRYESQMASYRASMSGPPGSSMGISGGYVPPPLRPGPIHFDAIHVELHHPKLSGIATALGFPYKALAQHSTERAHRGINNAVWQQAVETVEKRESR